MAEEAGQPHGLVRYHFGSFETRTLERATERIIELQRVLYAGDRPFLDKWRTAMEYLEINLREGYPKLVAELTATPGPPSCCCRPGRSHTAGSGRHRCPTSPGTTGW